MSEILQSFLDFEVTQDQYEDLWNFINSRSLIRGTFEGYNHIIMKTANDTYIIYKVLITPISTMKYQEAVVVGKDYLLKKINSAAYTKKLQNIKIIL